MNIVGENIKRIDAYDKATGKAKYPQDIYLKNMLYGATLRSIKPHAYIKVDISEGEKVPGIKKIFTAKDLPYNYHGVVFKDHEVFCSNKVRRIGDPIAFVVGENIAVVKQALNKIKVEYEELQGVFDPKKAMKKDSPKVHDDKDNLIHHFKIRKGDVDKAFEECDIIVENEYKVPQVDHVFMQPESGVATIDDKDYITLYTATQYPHFDVIEISEALNIEKDKVKIINCAVGGAFGGREDITMQIHLCLAAKVLKQPVKTTYTREESFLAHSKRHSMIMRYKSGVTKDGKLKALKATIIGDTGAYASWAINVMRKAGVHATGPYEIENVWIDSYAVYTNNPFSGAMRGFGATQVPVAYESQMDMLAQKLNINPVEFRLKNVLRNNSITATNQVLPEGVQIEKCIKEVEKHIDFSKKGSGLAAVFYGTGYGNGFPDVSDVKVKINSEGKLEIYTGASEVGQGAKTVLSQIGAQVLNLSIDDVIMINEDTSITPDSGTAAASRQTYNTGNAIKLACEKLKEEIDRYIATIENVEDKNYIDNLSENCKLSALYEAMGEKVLTKEYSFKAYSTKVDEETGEGNPYSPYTFGACGVEIEVNEENGEVVINKAVAVLDVGKAINPTMAEGQMDGGFAMGLGYALIEDLKVENGVMKNRKLSRYLIPTVLDMPELTKIIIEEGESSAPFGAKGIGEPVIVYVAPAILNGVCSYLGTRVNEIPLTNERIIKSLNNKAAN